MTTPIPTNRAELSAWTAAAATGGSIERVSDRVAVGITSDSRAVTAGSAFVALRGETHDGHAFVERAVDAGAILVIAEHGRAVEAKDADVVRVESTLDAWGALARAHLRAWRRARAAEDVARLVAITGSAGKTTTKELCAALLGAIAKCHKTSGNLNNRIGMPAVAFGVERTHRFAVMELGMSIPGEMAAMAWAVESDISAIVNIGVAHAAGVGGREGVAREKGALIAALAPSGTAIVNADDPAALGQLARTHASQALTFGRSESADYRLLDRVASGSGSRLTIERPCEACASPRARETIEVTLPLVGEAAAIDFVCALAIATAANGSAFDGATIESALARLVVPQGRVSIRHLADGTLILDDTYNANPASMRSALTTLAELAAPRDRRKVAVLGEMKELGAMTAGEHTTLGDAIADANVALAIGCGGAIELALARAHQRGVEIHVGRNTAEAAQFALANVAPGDCVLVKGSRSTKTEAVVEALVRSRGEVGGAS